MSDREVLAAVSAWSFWSFPSPLPSSGIDDRAEKFVGSISPKSSKDLLEKILKELEKKTVASNSVDQSAYWLRQLEHVLPALAKHDPQLEPFHNPFQSSENDSKAVAELTGKDELMAHLSLSDNFKFCREFCVTKYAEENVDFLHQIALLEKSAVGSDQEKQVMNYMIDTFLNSDAPRLVNVTFDKLDPIMEAKEAGTLERGLFDCVKEHIIQLTVQNVWIAYLESEQFEALVRHKLKLPVPSALNKATLQVDNQNFKEFIFGLSVLLTTTFKQLVSQVVGQVESPTKNGLFALFPVDGEPLTKLTGQLDKVLENLTKISLNGQFILKAFDQVFATIDGTTFNHFIKNTKSYSTAERGVHFQAVLQVLNDWIEKNLGKYLNGETNYFKFDYLTATAKLLSGDKEELTDDDYLKEVKERHKEKMKKKIRKRDKEELSDDDYLKEGLFPLDKNQQWHIIRAFEPSSEIPDDVKESFNDSIENREVKQFEEGDDYSPLHAVTPTLPPVQ